MRAFVVEEPRTVALRALNYAPTVERIRKAGSKSAQPLHEIVRSFGESYGSRFVNIHCDPAYGVEVLSQGDMFRTEPDGRFIRRDCIPHASRHRIDAGQLLIAGAGTLGENELFGRCLLADKRMAGKHVGPHAVALRFHEPHHDFSMFAYAWLASPTGLQAIRSTCYGTKILGLRLDLLASLPVPIAPPSVVRRVAEHVRTSVAGRESYVRHIEAARAVVSEIPTVALAQEGCAVRKRRSILWQGPFYSLGAWNVAGAGSALPAMRAGSRSKLADFLGVRGMYYGGRSARIPCQPPHGVDFVAQRDAFLASPIPRRVVLPGVTSDLLYAPEGSMLIAGRGTLGEGEIFGRSVQAVGRLSELVFTEDMLRLTLAEQHANFIFAFLSTHVGVQLIRTAAVGTKILKLREDLMRALPIPEASAQQLKVIDRSIARANASRADAHNAEAEAIRIIEEEVLPQWLA